MAKQAAGSAVVQFGETMVLAAATVSDTESPLPFFPLLVEYKDKAYAAGKIPGGFIKREGRPSDPEILKARIIDRSIRPLFPEGFKNEVQVFIYVVSADQENDADVMALVAASYAIGTVTAGSNSTVGGLVGVNLDSITASFAGGKVSGGNASFVGGLVGANGSDGAQATITTSYAIGSVAGGNNSTVGGLVSKLPPGAMSRRSEPVSLVLTLATAMR